MTGALDEISMAIGGLQQGMKNIERMLENNLEEIKNDKKETSERIGAVERDVQGLKNFRSRVYGIAGAVSVIGSAVGQYIGKKT